MEKNAEKKAVIKPKTLIDYIESEGKARLSIIIVDKKGKITKINKTDKEALPALKKFVNSL